MTDTVAPSIPDGGASTLGALDLRALSKTFAGGRALDSVDLFIREGEVHALLGGNGSGKSTLIKVLSGYHQPDPGCQIHIGGTTLPTGDPSASARLGARFVHQDLGLVESSSILDNLAIGVGFPTRLGTIRSDAARERAHLALAEVNLDVDPDDLVSTLSPAQKTSVAVARALQPISGMIARLLVLDEPTARLPEQEVEHLLDLVRSVSRRGIAVLYVTHRLDEVFEIAESTTVLRDGIRVFRGPVSSLTRDSLLQHLFGDSLEKTAQTTAAVSSASPILCAEHVCSESLADVSIEVRPGEIVGVAGITGSGREALCATLFGARPRDRGDVVVNGDTIVAGRPDLAMARGVAYVPAERKLHGGFLELTARENVTISDLGTFWRSPFLRRRKELSATGGWFEKLGVRPLSGVEQLFGSFSGGNQQKIVFAKWFQRRPVLFMLDEPTQGVDVGAKAELHRCLTTAAADGAAVLITSSDTEELTTVCTRILVLRNGAVVAELTGQQINPNTLARAVLGIENNERLENEQ